LQNIIYEQVVAKVWKDLKEHFSQGNAARVAELHQELFCFKPGSKLVTDFYTELKGVMRGT